MVEKHMVDLDDLAEDLLKLVNNELTSIDELGMKIWKSGFDYTIPDDVLEGTYKHFVNETRYSNIYDRLHDLDSENITGYDDDVEIDYNGDAIQIIIDIYYDDDTCDILIIQVLPPDDNITKVPSFNVLRRIKNS